MRIIQVLVHPLLSNSRKPIQTIVETGEVEIIWPVYMPVHEGILWKDVGASGVRRMYTKCIPCDRCDFWCKTDKS